MQVVGFNVVSTFGYLESLQVTIVVTYTSAFLVLNGHFVMF
jgi:hypothetical protein